MQTKISGDYSFSFRFLLGPRTQKVLHHSESRAGGTCAIADSALVLVETYFYPIPAHPNGG
jgi:hypothetical protein